MPNGWTWTPAELELSLALPALTPSSPWEASWLSPYCFSPTATLFVLCPYPVSMDSAYFDLWPPVTASSKMFTSFPGWPWGFCWWAISSLQFWMLKYSMHLPVHILTCLILYQSTKSLIWLGSSAFETSTLLYTNPLHNLGIQVHIHGNSYFQPPC